MFGRRQRGQRSQEKVLGRSEHAEHAEHAERLALGREEEEALRLQEQLRRVEALGSAEREMDVKEISRLLEKEKLEEKVVEALEQEVFSEKQELLERKKSSEPLGAWEPLTRPLGGRRGSGGRSRRRRPRSSGRAARPPGVAWSWRRRRSAAT